MISTTRLAVVTMLLFAFAWVGFTAGGAPGGYSARALTEDIKTVAEFAVQEDSKRQAAPVKLNNIFKAEKQIVECEFRCITQGVEARGVEPLSSKRSTQASTCLSGDDV